MKKILVWDPSSIKKIAKVLFAEARQPCILLEDYLSEREIITGVYKYIIEHGVLHRNYTPSIKFIGKIKPINSCLGNEGMHICIPKTEEDMEFLLQQLNGWVTVFFSDIVALEVLSSFLTNYGSSNKSLMDYYFEIQSCCNFSAWFGLPIWENDRNMIVIAKNDEVWDKIYMEIIKLGEIEFDDATKARSRWLSSIDYPSAVYYSDLEIELRATGAVED